MERGDDEELGLFGNVSDEGVVFEEEVEWEEFDKDDVDCCFIESSWILIYVVKKDYFYWYFEVCVYVLLIFEE